MDPVDANTVGSAARTVDDDPMSRLAWSVADQVQGQVHEVQGQTAPQAQSNEYPQGAKDQEGCTDGRTTEAMSVQDRQAGSHDPQLAGSLGKLSSTPQQAEQAAGVLPQVDQEWHQCQEQLKTQMGKMNAHWRLIPWNDIMNEIENKSHPFPPREGGLCRNRTCEYLGHEDQEQYRGYCCKQLRVEVARKMSWPSSVSNGGSWPKLLRQKVQTGDE